MTHLKRTITLLTLICLMAVSGTALAGPQEPREEDSAVELTQTQRREILKSRTRHMETLVGLDADQQRLSIRELEIMDSADPDLKKLRAIVTEEARIEGLMHLVEIDALEDIRRILGPEQWKSFFHHLSRMDDEQLHGQGHGERDMDDHSDDDHHMATMEFELDDDPAWDMDLMYDVLLD